MASSVALSTQRQYAPAWQRWRRFMIALSPLTLHDAAPDSLFAPRGSSLESRVRLLMMFTHFLATDLDMSAEAVSQTLSALRYKFRCLLCDTTAFDHPQLLACRKALLLDPAAFHGAPRQTLPATLEMIHSIVNHFDTASRHKRIVAVAAVLAFCCLLRPSEYCRTQSAEDGTRHVLRAEQILFECITAPGESRFFPAHALPASARYSDCRTVKIVFTSAKNIPLRGSRTLWFSTTASGGIELTRTLFNWARDANLRAKDHFLSYRENPVAPSHPLSYHRLNGVLKYTARLFNLPAAHYSCHSFRVGGASLLRAAGADDGEILSMGRWRSLPACLGYQAPSTATNDRLLHLLSSPDMFTTRDVLLGVIPDNLRARRTGGLIV